VARVFVIRDFVLVNAPIERCFQLSTSIEIVERELHMHPVRGRMSGFVQGGDTVHWKGWQLCLPQFHVSLIEAFRSPAFFRDRMITGRFRSFEHDHHFLLREDGSVLMYDEIRFSMKMRFGGDLAGHLLLAPHIRRVLRRRLKLLKRIAETDEWKRYLAVAG
jgi:ligand-binding SRPBCC domain-containing protein